ncbi:MAG TPA: class II glutamine amidotransferase [Xanthobacteraceae bacterium]|jgi:glutamine amidotransferase|nr:class II glutamine amidotransferase [Xanthobacteraceae bacterium]
MCRVLMYRGESVVLDDLLYKPNNSLVKQAHDPQLLDMLSLAGFGMLAWDFTSYNSDIPFNYYSVNIPVFDQNLKKLAEKIRINTLLAHVRGVVFDHNPTVGPQNLHPFRYDGYGLALAQNGYLAGFGRIRFDLLVHIKPEIARLIKGNTDTEWLYALLLSQFKNSTTTVEPDDIILAVKATFSILRDIRRRHDIKIASPVNLFITDGSNLVAARFTLDYGCYDMQDLDEIKRSEHLYLGIWYTTGKSYGFHDNEWKMTGGTKATGSTIISSEPLTRDTSTWFEVPEYSAIVVADGHGSQQIRIESLDV